MKLSGVPVKAYNFRVLEAFGFVCASAPSLHRSVYRRSNTIYAVVVLSTY